MYKTRAFIVSVIITLGIVMIANVVVYMALLTIISILFPHSFLLSDSVTFAIKIILAFLSLSFAAALFISFNFNNILVRFFYRLATVWTGLLLYLFFAATLYGLACLFVPTFLTSFSLALSGGILMIAACAVTLYGILNANHIRITYVNVALPALPQAWQGKKAVWLSDIHLGHVRGKSFAQKISDVIVSLDLPASTPIFIGGDLFDGVYVDERAIIEPLRVLTARHPVYFIMGNHEQFHDEDTEEYLQAIKDIGVRVLEDEMIILDGLQIIGVDHGHTDTAEKFTAVLEKIKKGGKEGNFDRTKPSLLLKHEPRDLDVAAEAGVTFQISGHTHQGQIFPVNLLTKIAFRGFDYGLKKYSTGMQVFTSSGVGTWGLPLRVGTRSEIVLFTFTDSVNKEDKRV